MGIVYQRRYEVSKEKVARGGMEFLKVGKESDVSEMKECLISVNVVERMIFLMGRHNSAKAPTDV